MKLSHQYVAGFVDGEGCISIFTHRKKGLVRPVMVPILKVTQKRYGILMAMRKYYGGIGHVGPNGRSPKAPWNWTLKGQSAALVVKAILPYLNLKKPNAKVMLKLARLQKEWASKHLHTISAKEYESRQKLVQECRRLNRKGGDAEA